MYSLYAFRLAQIHLCVKDHRFINWRAFAFSLESVLRKIPYNTSNSFTASKYAKINSLMANPFLPKKTGRGVSYLLQQATTTSIGDSNIKLKKAKAQLGKACVASSATSKPCVRETESIASISQVKPALCKGM